MFKQLSALLLVLPVISALQLNLPTTQIRTESSITITWTVSSGDPATFDLYLANESFHNTYALKNVVTTSDGTITVTIPVVDPGSGYTFRASPIGDVNSVLSQTAQFDIGQAVSSSSSLPSSSTSSRPGSSTSTLSGGPLSTSISGLGSTISKTSTPGGSSSSTSTSPGTTATGSFNGGNSGALSVTGIGATVVGVLVAAGAFLGL